MSKNDPDARSRLLRTAGHLFRRQGYTATGVKQLLDTSGTVAGSLYHHFPGGKEELAEEVVRQAGQDINRILSASLDESGTQVALDRFVGWLARSMKASGGLDGCPIAPVAIESVIAGPALQQAAAAQFASWARTIAARLEAEGRAPEQARALSQVILSAIEGALLLSRTSGDTTALTDLRTVLPALLSADQHPAPLRSGS